MKKNPHSCQNTLPAPGSCHGTWCSPGPWLISQPCGLLRRLLRQFPGHVLPYLLFAEPYFLSEIPQALSSIFELHDPNYSVWLLFSEINKSDSILVIRHTLSQHSSHSSLLSFPHKSIKSPFATVPHFCSCGHRHWQQLSGANSSPNSQCSWSDCRFFRSYTTVC